MSHPNRPLVVGAGPVGLGAALFLTRQGRIPRVIEMRDEPSRQSQALAINPRTLDILEPTGLTQQMLELGLPIRGARFYQRGRVVAALSFASIHPDYPFMLALSQATTERLLGRTLEAAGGEVERGVKMVNQLPQYDRLRRPVDQRIVRRVEFLSRVVSAESRFYRFVRTFLFPMAARVPFVRARMVATVTGLDHELPQVVTDRAS